MKAYCKDCRYLKSLLDEELIYYCCHPDNIIVVDSWLKTYNRYKKEPAELNKNNDCKGFECSRLTGSPKRLQMGNKNESNTL